MNPQAEHSKKEIFEGHVSLADPGWSSSGAIMIYFSYVCLYVQNM